MMKGRGLVWLVDEKKRMEFKKTREWINSLAVCDTTVAFLRFEKFILTFMSTDLTSYADGICMVSFFNEQSIDSLYSFDEYSIVENNLLLRKFVHVQNNIYVLSNLLFQLSPIFISNFSLLCY